MSKSDSIDKYKAIKDGILKAVDEYTRGCTQAGYPVSNFSSSRREDVSKAKRKKLPGYNERLK